MKLNYPLSKRMNSILIIDDEEFIRDNLNRILEKDGYRTFLARKGLEGIEIAGREDIDLVLLDLNLPDINGIEVLKQIKQIDSSMLVIVITGYATVDSAVEALKLGAYDYIKKPFKADAIKLIVKLALETLILKKEVNILKRLGRRDSRIIAESQAMKDVIKNALEVAKHPETGVLITGESGTGKEVIARLIHEESDRSSYPFVDINCASLPEQLLESELFGYEKGAFTDARSSKTGLFEEANLGTLFLDEIGEMPPSLQAKLLRVIETKSFRKVGGNKNIQLNIRIIAATNKDLKKAVEDKNFREDLFYRLNIFPIHISPLRERKEDIIPLANYFLQQFSKKFGKNMTKIDERVKQVFLSYLWKGNVRELKNIIERVCIMHNDDTLRVEYLPSDIKEGALVSVGFDKKESPLIKKVEATERELLIEALSKTKGNVLQASKLLGIPRGTLRHKIQKYKIVLAKISQ